MKKEETAEFLTSKKKTAKTSSATVKFTEEEIDMMSKTFKKEFIANGLAAHVIRRPSGKNGGVYYEIRYRRNGYNISVANKDLKVAKALFVKATRHFDPPEVMAQKKLTFGKVCAEWLEYKQGKVAEQTWQEDKTNSEKYVTEDLRTRPIVGIKTIDIDRFMRGFDAMPRKYEDMRTLLNSVFKYARANGFITNNPVELVPFKRAERQNRNRMSDDQLGYFLRKIREPRYDRIRQTAYVLYFFGLRPCEIDEAARFENGFLICRNRKRKGGKVAYKKIPVPKQAQGLIDFNCPIIPPLSYDRWLDLMKETLGEGLTPYNLRHTFASICAEGARAEVVEIWMGDSPERLVGRTYVHYSDDYMKAQMDLVDFPV